jgi:hypothetical protein
MAELPDINALRNKYVKLKDELIKEWESAVDENGTFFFVFGNPKTNPCAYQGAKSHQRLSNL